MTKSVEYHAKVAAVIDDDGKRRIVAHTAEGKVVIFIEGPILAGREYPVEIPCA